jgi:glycosyltransferase AglD
MPAHNEESYLATAVGSVVEGLRKRGVEFEVLVVENGSKDSTCAEARRLEATDPEIRVIELDFADYGLALRSGFLHSHGDIVVNFDVDMVHLDFLDSAMCVMANPDVAIVIGSKRSPGADDQRALGRKFVTSVFSAVLRHGFGLNASDTHGLKALRRAPLLAVLERCRFGSDIFDTELVLRAERAGLEVRELPVVVADLRPPRTAISRRIPRTLVGLCNLWLALRRDP